MDNDNRPTTPLGRLPSSLSRSYTSKRDSLAAELERGETHAHQLPSPSRLNPPRSNLSSVRVDPQLSTAKRQQRKQTFTSHLAHASLERQLVAAQTAKTELETKLREKDAVIERLEEDRRWLAEREKEEKEEKEREREERAEEKRKTDNEVRSLRAALATLRERYADLEDEHASLSRSTTQTAASQKAQLSTLARQVSLLEEEVANYKRLADERTHALEELQAQLDNLNAAQDGFVHKESDEESWPVVREELHRQVEYMRTLENTNAKMSAELAVLKDRHASIEVLKEQKNELERKVQRSEDLQRQVVRLEAELDAARQEREQWASDNANLSCSTASQTPVSVTQSLANLRLTHARLLEEHSAAIASLRQREVELAEAERLNEEAGKSLDKLQAEYTTLKDSFVRMRHSEALHDRELSFLRAMLASFTAEEASQKDIKIEEATNQRLQHLEDLVTDYKAMVRNLQGELAEVRADPSNLDGGHGLKLLREELENEKAARAEAQRALQDAETAATEANLERIEELEQTLFELRGEIGAGRHLPPGVRVLCLKENPAHQWADLSQAAMDRLRSENKALLQRLKALEDSGFRSGAQDASGEQMVPRESWEVVNQEKAKLEEELKQREKRLMRLQQVYQAKTAEFREAIASILGVKLAFYQNGGVRVTSQFDLDAAFVFQPTSTGEGMKMQLVAQGEGGPEELPQLMRYWVEQEQCIPGFLASVTLDCYEKSKTRRRE